MKTLILITALCTAFAMAETPSEALKAFKKAAQANDFDGAWQHTAKFERFPEQLTTYFKGEVRDFLELMAKGWDFEILEERIDGDCAVVVINEHKKKGRGSFDLDPAYLIKQGDEWMVLPGFTNWNNAEQALKNQVATLEKLKAWFKERKAELKEAHNQ